MMVMLIQLWHIIMLKSWNSLLPGEEECFKLLKLHLDKYVADDMKEFLLVAEIEGIFRRWIAELWQLQAVIYVSENCVVDPSLSREIVDSPNDILYFN